MLLFFTISTRVFMHEYSLLVHIHTRVYVSTKHSSMYSSANSNFGKSIIRDTSNEYTRVGIRAHLYLRLLGLEVDEHIVHKSILTGIEETLVQ